MPQKNGFMEVVWRGDIIMGDNNENLKDLQFTIGDDEIRNLNEITYIPMQPLKYIGLVNIAQIPLYLAAGPSMLVDVYDSRYDLASTLSWSLEANPASQESHTNDVAAECPKQSSIGLLTAVEQASYRESEHRNPRITEILIYSVYEPRQKEPSFYAWPISSTLIYPPSALIKNTRSGLASSNQPRSSDVALSSDGLAVNQDRLDDMFDAASQKRQKRKQKGAEWNPLTVAEDSTLVKTEKNNTLQSNTTCRDSATFEQDPTVGASDASFPLERTKDSKSIGSRGVFEDESIETRNRQAISRVVMAGMRIYGLQQRSTVATRHDANTKQSQTGTQPETVSQNDSSRASVDAEYKAVYHQVFKGTVFAFRHGIEREILKYHAIRDVVDRLLAVFCQDP